MEEKYPIKFSLGQFILLLGVEVVVLSLVFLLGARFGNGIFPGGAPEMAAVNPAFQNLAPDVAPQKPAKPAVAKLVDTPEEEGNEAEEGDEALAEMEGVPDAAAPEAPVQVNKSLFHNPADKNTLIRFKSSGNSRFAIEVGQYFDEMIASKEITQLKGKGYEAYLVIQNSGGGARSYGVRIGSFADRTIAEDYATKMSNDQGIELRVVQVD